MARLEARAQRKTAFLKARMLDRGEWLEIIIGNLSTSGLMVKSRVPQPLGTTVEIRRRGVVIAGEVVWSLPTRFGMRSFEPIDVDALTAEAGLDVHRSREEAPSRAKLWHWRHST